MRDDCDFGRLGEGGPTSGQVQAQAARSLALLNAIESTVSRTTANTLILRALTNEFAEFEELLARAHPHSILDPEGRAVDLLRKGSSTAQRIYNHAVKCRESAREDRRLTGEDGVEDAYSELIAASADMHNVIEECRDTLETLDALQGAPGEKVYADIDTLMADIFAGR